MPGLSGPELRDALALGLHEAGAQVTDIGMCGTEEIYYAAANQPFGAGVMITGSHNPADENGFKLVRGRGHTHQWRFRPVCPARPG